MNDQPTITANAAAAAVGKELAGLLRAHPPVVATAEGQVMLPWRIGLGAELLALRWESVPGRKVRGLMKAYTRSVSYLRAVAAPRSTRHALTGCPVADVSEEHRQEARQALAERRVRIKGRGQGTQIRRPEPGAPETRPQAPQEGLQRRVVSAANGARPVLRLGATRAA